MNSYGLRRVGDEYVRLPCELAGGKDPVEQLPGFTDERPAHAVFICPRRFADQHDLGIGITLAEDSLPPGLTQSAAPAAIDLRFQLPHDPLPYNVI